MAHKSSVHAFLWAHKLLKKTTEQVYRVQNITDRRISNIIKDTHSFSVFLSVMFNLGNSRTNHFYVSFSLARNFLFALIFFLWIIWINNFTFCQQLRDYDLQHHYVQNMTMCATWRLRFHFVQSVICMLLIILHSYRGSSMQFELN